MRSELLREKLRSFRAAREDPARTARSIRAHATPAAHRALHAMLERFAKSQGVTLPSLQAREREAVSIYSFAEWLVLDSGLYSATWEEDLEFVLSDLTTERSRLPDEFPVQGDDAGATSIPFWLAIEVRARLSRRNKGAPSLLAIARSGGFNASELTGVFPLWRDADSILDSALSVPKDSP